MSHMRVWGFRIRPDRRADFEALYGMNGAWVALFRRDREFVATELWRDQGDADFYVTVDRWRSRESFERFLEVERAAYETLDDSGEVLTVAEWFIGAFDDSTDVRGAT
jgi:heme-degrading monooxygenase HmoA